MTKMKDITSKSDKELTEFIEEKRESVRGFRFAVAGSRPRNVREVRANKRDIARAMTEQTKRMRTTTKKETK